MVWIPAITVLLLNIVQNSEAAALLSTINSQHNAILTSGNISCIISNDELYVNGKHKGPLSAAQKEEFERYSKGVNLWGMELHRCLQQEMEASMRRMMKVQEAINRVFTEDGFFSSTFSSFRSLLDDDHQQTKDKESEHKKESPEKPVKEKSIEKKDESLGSADSFPDIPSFCKE